MKIRHLLVPLGVLALVVTTSCSSRFSTYCENRRNCEGGNDADEDACVEAQRTGENVADAYDCADQFDALTDCLDAVTVCKDRNLDTSACSASRKALSDCQEAASGRKHD